MPCEQKRTAGPLDPGRLLVARGRVPYSASPPSAALWLGDPEDLSIAPLSFGGLLRRLRPRGRSLCIGSRHRHRCCRDSDVGRRAADLFFGGRRGASGGLRLIGGSPLALRIGAGQSGDLLRGGLNHHTERGLREPDLLCEPVDPIRDRCARAVVAHAGYAPPWTASRHPSSISFWRSSRRPPLSAITAHGGPEDFSQTARSGSCVVKPRSQRVATSQRSPSSASSRADFHVLPRRSARAADHSTSTAWAIVVGAGGDLTGRTPPRPARSMPIAVSHATDPCPQTQGIRASHPAAS